MVSLKVHSFFLENMFGSCFAGYTSQLHQFNISLTGCNRKWVLLFDFCGNLACDFIRRKKRSEYETPPVDNHWQNKTQAEQGVTLFIRSNIPLCCGVSSPVSFHFPPSRPPPPFPSVPTLPCPPPAISLLFHPIILLFFHLYYHPFREFFFQKNNVMNWSNHLVN